MSLTSSALKKTIPTPDFESRTPQKTTPTPNFESRTPQKTTPTPLSFKKRLRLHNPAAAPKLFSQFSFPQCKKVGKSLL